MNVSVDADEEVDALQQADSGPFMPVTGQSNHQQQQQQQLVGDADDSRMREPSMSAKRFMRSGREFMRFGRDVRRA